MGKSMRAIAALALALALSACSGKGHAGTSPPTTVPPNSQVPGRHAVLGVYNYDDPGASLPHIGAEAVITSALIAAGWTQVENYTDSNVDTTSFTGVMNYADALFFVGHGQAGLFNFTHLNNQAYGYDKWAWGPGPTSLGIPFNLSGMPVNNRLHWIFALSSDTVAGSTNQDPNSPGWTTNWNPAFGGSLHGLYGFWQGPGYCYTLSQTSSSRSCDVTTYQMPQIAKLLPVYLYTAGKRSQYVHDAWIQTASDGGMAVGWSMWEDNANRYDVFTGPGGIQNQAPSGNRAFYYGSGTQIQPFSAITVHPDTAPLQPRVAIPENISDQTLVQTYQPYVSSISTVSDGTNIDNFTTTEGIHTRHNTSTGAISYHGVDQDNPVNFSQGDALTAATAFVQNSLGMPADAVLQAVDVHRRFDQLSGSDVLVGYEFVWGHSSSSGSPYVGDAIRVIVNDDLQAHQGACLAWDYTAPDPPLRPVKYCSDYSYTYTDIPDISYAYRMWHGLAASRSELSAGRSTGDPSIDAYTASLSLPANAIITAYSYGYWNGTFDQLSGSSAGQPAWIFTLGGGNAVVAVDAFSGAILGQVVQ